MQAAKEKKGNRNGIKHWSNLIVVYFIVRESWWMGLALLSHCTQISTIK